VAGLTSASSNHHIHQSPPAHGPVSPSKAGSHGRGEPGEVPLSPYRRQLQLDYAIPDCGAGWALGAFLRSERHEHELGEELVPSYLYQVHLYYRLETDDYGRFLSDQYL
jgi:hypothetical protein